MARIIDGKFISSKEKETISKEVAELSKSGIVPGLAVVIVGNDPASEIYVRNKHRACEACGIHSEIISLDEAVPESELLSEIDKLNRREDIDGILVQLPLPKSISEEKVTAAILPEKDVDAFHLENVGRIVSGNYRYLPCTPAGMMKMLEYEGISVKGKECVVVGRSNIVGKPMALMLLNADATVTVCHSKTENLSDVTKRADILVVAVGKPCFITGDMVKEGAVVLDVGINRSTDGKLCGDVDFPSVEPKVAAITPVPGGVGPMTITMLLRNTLTAAKRRAKTGLRL